MGRRKFRTVSVEVDVDIDEWDTDSLVDELKDRYDELNTEQRRKIHPYFSDGWTPSNLDHKMKFELFLKHIDDYFYTEFEKRLAGEGESLSYLNIDEYPERFVRL